MCLKQLLPFAYFPVCIFCLFDAKIYMIPHKSRSLLKLRLSMIWYVQILASGIHILCVLVTVDVNISLLTSKLHSLTLNDILYNSYMADWELYFIPL